MAAAADGFLERFRHRRAVAGWARLTAKAPGLAPARLELVRAKARELRRHLDRLVIVADRQLEAAPDLGGHLPLGTDWSWRPDLWMGRLPQPGLAPVLSGAAVGDGVAIFHDCPLQHISLRQLTNPGRDGLPALAVQLEVFGFEGSFLSMVIDLPEAAAQGLKLRHLIRLEIAADCERPLTLFARLNLRHGPNLEQIVRQHPMDRDRIMVEFDLAYTRMNGRRMEKIWLDLIFQDPAMNRITLRDVALSRHPRAEL